VARKNKHAEHVNNERWLVSYADFITLLFAFFVVMFSVSQVDSKRVGRFTQSFTEALDWSGMQAGGQGLLTGGKADTKQKSAAIGNARAASRALESAAVSETLQKLREAFEKESVQIPELKGLTVIRLRGEVVLRLPERLMFDVGDARLHDDGRKALSSIADVLASRPVRVRVEGHTDAKPISTPRYPSNWELSTDRAVAVVRYFVESGKLEPKALSAAGYGEYHPIADNDTPEGRAMNRRVDIILVASMDNGDDAGEPTP
jgi:chemotaxis protein MotB